MWILLVIWSESTVVQIFRCIFLTPCMNMCARKMRKEWEGRQVSQTLDWWPPKGCLLSDLISSAQPLYPSLSLSLYTCSCNNCPIHIHSIQLIIIYKTPPFSLSLSMCIISFIKLDSIINHISYHYSPVLNPQSDIQR